MDLLSHAAAKMTPVSPLSCPKTLCRYGAWKVLFEQALSACIHAEFLCLPSPDSSLELLIAVLEDVGLMCLVREESHLRRA